jgi:hypothetical protein
MNRKKAQNYEIGSLVSVVNAAKTQLGYCIIEAADGDGVLICRLFSGSYAPDPSSFSPIEDGRLVRMGDLCIIEGRWKVVGVVPENRRSMNEVFQFVSRSMFGDQWLVQYDQMARLVSRTRIGAPEACATLPEDDLFGCGAVEKLLEGDARNSFTSNPE